MRKEITIKDFICDIQSLVNNLTCNDYLSQQDIDFFHLQLKEEHNNTRRYEYNGTTILLWQQNTDLFNKPITGLYQVSAVYQNDSFPIRRDGRW